MMSLVSPTTSLDEDTPVPRGRPSHNTPRDSILHPKVGELVQYRANGQVILCEISRVLVEPKLNTVAFGQYILLDLHIIFTRDVIMASRVEIEYPLATEREGEIQNN